MSKLSDCKIEKIEEMASKGIPDVQIAEEVNVSTATAMKYSRAYWNRLMEHKQI